ncbi:hypothetical protein [Spiroplasma endosymbiont of Aleiodes alternator]|uniref:hypothetical protein n=1 Tax=Spiroplasma endosymbiont of Aleiodes alternator TaxID=3139329 RepID=UPI003CCAAD14
MAIEKQKIIFNDYINKIININELKKKIYEELKTLEKKIKKQNEIKENISKILYGLEDENFEIKENLRLLDLIYTKIENIYKNPIEQIECKNKNLIFNNWYMKFRDVEEINKKISKNNQNIQILNSKKISKWKNSLIIVFTLGFYNKNQKIIKNVEKIKHIKKIMKFFY